MQVVCDPEGNGTPSYDGDEAAAVFARFWRRIWNLPLVQTEEAFARWVRAVGPPRERQPWVPLQPEELRAVAKRSRGKAAGFSGWSGSELDDWPPPAWEAAARLYNWMFREAQFPRVWRQMRQVHILKPGARPRLDGAWHASDGRPVSIECAELRNVGTAIAQRSTTRNWCAAWTPKTMCGGVRGRGVATAVLRLDHAFDQAYLLSLDMAKAFDHCQLELVLECL